LKVSSDEPSRYQHIHQTYFSKANIACLFSNPATIERRTLREAHAVIKRVFTEEIKAKTPIHEPNSSPRKEKNPLLLTSILQFFPRPTSVSFPFSSAPISVRQCTPSRNLQS